MKFNKVSKMDKIELIKGDITQMDVDVIVNAANASLRGGGGVDGAIHSAGGQAILKECKAIGYCPVGDAVITTAGKLKAKKVIHTVGPIWKGGKNHEKEKLKKCYLNSLNLAKEQGYKTIAFPNISTGVYHFPKALAAELVIATVKDYLEHDHHFKKVYFVTFGEENYQLYHEQLK